MNLEFKELLESHEDKGWTIISFVFVGRGGGGNLNGKYFSRQNISVDNFFVCTSNLFGRFSFSSPHPTKI